MTLDIKSDLKQQITRGDLDDVIRYLYDEGYCKIDLLSRYNENEDNYTNKLILNNEYVVNRNQIRKQVVELIDKLSLSQKDTKKEEQIQASHKIKERTVDSEKLQDVFLINLENFLIMNRKNVKDNFGEEHFELLAGFYLSEIIYDTKKIISIIESLEPENSKFSIRIDELLNLSNSLNFSLKKVLKKSNNYQTQFGGYCIEIEQAIKNIKTSRNKSLSLLGQKQIDSFEAILDVDIFYLEESLENLIVGCNQKLKRIADYSES